MGAFDGGGEFWTQSTIKLEIGERGGAHVQSTMTMTTTMRPGAKKYMTTNHKQWENATGNRGEERWRCGELAIGGESNGGEKNWERW
jgi:hypothetical protein